MDEYGTDALRFALLTGSGPGNDLSLSLERVASGRNFANKLWNAGRLILGAIAAVPGGPAGKPPRTPADIWILSRLNQVIREVDRLFAGHQYGEAGRQIHDFFWREFADWYLELSKIQSEEGGDRAWLTGRVLVHVYHNCLRLLHPYMPFVTEELFGALRSACEAHPAHYGPKRGWEPALIVAKWAEAGPEEPWEQEGVAAFRIVQDLVTAIRNARAERGVEAGRRIEAAIRAGDRAEFLQSNRAALAWLARLDPDRLQIEAELETPPESIRLVVGPVEAFLPLAGMLDLAAEQRRLAKQYEGALQELQRLERLLAGDFATRAPRELVARERAKLEATRSAAERLAAQLKDLE
jgi:valyl-tRNA synthetase